MKLLSQSGIYLGASLLSKAAPFLLLPVMTRYLNPAEFGALSLFLLINSCVGAFVGMNIHANISRSFFSLSKSELSELIGNILVIMFFAAVFVTVLFSGAMLFVDSAFSLPISSFLIMPFLSFMMMVNTINLTILRNEGRAYVYGLFEVACTFLIISITVCLLLFSDGGWYSQVVGMLVTYGVFFFIAIIYMSRRGYLRLNVLRGEIERILKLSAPMIPYVLSGVVMNVSDRVFIERMVGLDAVGHYAIGYNFGMIVLICTDAFNKAWSPWFYKLMLSPVAGGKEKVVRYTYLYIVFIFALAALVALASSFVIPWMVAESFYEASAYVFWIALAFAIQGVYKMLFPYFILVDKYYALSGVLVISALLNLLFNYLLIGWFGAVGAAYSSALAWAVAVFLAFLYTRKFYAMPWGLRHEEVD
ncbi:oligosaccharide flippase family protein [uncultured Porticoccus sp.]|uniref:lipopolysaccharide biosynthesis protein n=1 Tax=uncultured Porticoccus sp. TaxID=1256050 RepID=UPI002630820C|nr:oligosaccharide flippase family protein [uncultured Porticoccus sp.]